MILSRNDITTIINTAHHHGETPDISGATLADNINLEGIDLTGVNMSRIIAPSAVLTHTDLTRTNLTGAYLPHADLSMSIMDGTILNGANLSLADLSGATIRNVDFARVNIESADLRTTEWEGMVIDGIPIPGTTDNRLMIVPTSNGPSITTNHGTEPVETFRARYPDDEPIIRLLNAAVDMLP